MKLSEIPYKRPDFRAYEKAFTDLLKDFGEAGTPEAQFQTFQELYVLRDHYSTMNQLAFIRYTLDTGNEEYQKEVDFFDQVNPMNEKLVTAFYKALLNARFKEGIRSRVGDFLFQIAEKNIKRFDDSILEELKQENALNSEYMKLKGSAKIEFEGETFNLAGIGKFLVSRDRSIREKASAARWEFFASKKEELDEIYDKLVKLRHTMARKLGYRDFIELGYIRMGRMDYNEDMVDSFRKEIRTHVIPVVQELRERQRRRLGYEKLMEYDLGFNFHSGNPEPKGSPAEILEKGRHMYHELSPETDEFFQHMQRNELMEVINRPGKADMGYCSELSDYRYPFIFANFNGTAGDIEVLTHEAGHAFMYYCSGHHPVSEYRWPTAEACEIHSMSMEYLTYPWMKDFFGKDTEKFYFTHINDSMLFLPYGCAVDHFQHIIYKEPGLSPDERAKAWKEMERMYLPDRDLNSNPYLQSGRFWQRQGHIFEGPFYYIDYVLAGICAFQYWQMNAKDPDNTWKSYLDLCKAGGTAPFLQLVENAGLRSPFQPGVVQGIASDVKSYLDTFNDRDF